jgi:hypothetical protein
MEVVMIRLLKKLLKQPLAKKEHVLVGSVGSTYAVFNLYPIHKLGGRYYIKKESDGYIELKQYANPDIYEGCVKDISFNTWRRT